MRRRSRIPVAAALSIAVAGLCSACGAGEAGSDVAVRDSAGVRIVENRAPAPAEWSLGEPVEAIGTADGPASSQLYRVSAATLVERADGPHVYIGSNGTHDVREFGPDGRLLRTFGGEGEGPGEFRSVDDVVVKGDTVLVLDRWLGRLTRFAPDGGRSVTHLRPQATGGLSEARLLSDGTVVAEWLAREPIEMLRGGEAKAGRVARGSILLVRHGSDGAPLDTLGEFPGTESSLTPAPDGAINVGRVPFAHTFAMATRGRDVVVGTQEHYELRVLAPSGTPTSIVRAPDGDLTITDARLEGLARLFEARGADAATVKRLMAYVRSAPLPPTAPAFGRIVASADGSIWVSAAAPWGSIETGGWDVFDAGGRRVAHVHAPPRFRVLEVDSAAVVGVRRDSMDVERVELRPLAATRHGADAGA